MCPASASPLLVVGWLLCSWNDITIMRGIQQQFLCPLPFPSECQISIPSRRRWSVPLGISAALPPSHPICQTPPPPHVPLLPPAASHSLLSERAFISGDWGTLSCSRLCGQISSLCHFAQTISRRLGRRARIVNARLFSRGDRTLFRVESSFGGSQFRTVVTSTTLRPANGAHMRREGSDDK